MESHLNSVLHGVSGVSNGTKMATFLEVILAPELVVAPDSNIESPKSIMAPDTPDHILAAWHVCGVWPQTRQTV